MAKFHIKDDGEPGVCAAQDGNCPFGAEEPHFTTKEAARAHFERMQSLTSGGSFGKSDRAVWPLAFPGSKEDEEFELSADTIYEFVDAEEAYDTDSYETHNNNIVDSEGAKLTINTRTEIFDGKGNVLTRTDEYALAVYDDADARDNEIHIVFEEVDPDAGLLLTRDGSIARHRWLLPNMRVSTLVKIF